MTYYYITFHITQKTHTQYTNANCNQNFHSKKIKIKQNNLTSSQSISTWWVRDPAKRRNYTINIYTSQSKQNIYTQPPKKITQNINSQDTNPQNLMTIGLSCNVTAFRFFLSSCQFQKWNKYWLTKSLQSEREWCYKMISMFIVHCLIIAFIYLCNFV